MFAIAVFTTRQQREFFVLYFQDGKRDDNRVHHMRLLRQLCLPTMCFLLNIVLNTTHQYKKCLQLADVIASEQHHLYKVFCAIVS